MCFSLPVAEGSESCFVTVLDLETILKTAKRWKWQSNQEHQICRRTKTNRHQCVSKDVAFMHCCFYAFLQKRNISLIIVVRQVTICMKYDFEKQLSPGKSKWRFNCYQSWLWYFIAAYMSHFNYNWIVNSEFQCIYRI